MADALSPIQPGDRCPSLCYSSGPALMIPGRGRAHGELFHHRGGTAFFSVLFTRWRNRWIIEQSGDRGCSTGVGLLSRDYRSRASEKAVSIDFSFLLSHATLWRCFVVWDSLQKVSVQRCNQLGNTGYKRYIRLQRRETCLTGLKPNLSLSNRLKIYRTITKPVWMRWVALWKTEKTTTAKMKSLQAIILRAVTDVSWYIRNDDIRKGLEILILQVLVTN